MGNGGRSMYKIPEVRKEEETGGGTNIDQESRSVGQEEKIIASEQTGEEHVQRAWGHLDLKWL